MSAESSSARWGCVLGSGTARGAGLWFHFCYRKVEKMMLRHRAP